MADEAQPDPAPSKVRARIQEIFDSQPLMRHLGARLGLIASGRVHIVLPDRPEIRQQHGFFHAGATCAVGDAAGEFAALTLLTADHSDLLGIEYKVNFLAPAKGDHVEAIGTVIKSGRTLTVCSFEVWGVAEAGRSLVATGQQTLIRVDTRPSP